MTSKIEWTELTWNPVTGCTPISEGCQNCYAQRMHKRLQAMGQAKYQHDFNQVVCHKEELHRDFGKGRMVFVNSMSDLFHEDIQSGFLADVLTFCYRKKAIFQILTKRSERLRFFYDVIPPNVWLGVSVELAKYKHRIDDLRKINAKVKFISFEPLLGDVGELDLTGIDWVIVGGESGPCARPMHPDWVRNIRDQALAQGCKFLFKQWGEWAPSIAKRKPEGGFEPHYWVGNSQQCTFKNKVQIHDWKRFDNEGYYTSFKVGKKKAGRELDGRIWDEFPERQ